MSKDKPTFTTMVTRADGSIVSFDSLPEEEKQRIATNHNKKAIEIVAQSEGLKANFIEKGTA